MIDPSVRHAPLQGIRVLDLSRILAGPTCSQNLADLGADVIKIERPTHGDDTRGWGPPYFKNASGENTTESAYYISANRNKRSITVDITTPEGIAIIQDLAKVSDIVLENYKVGGLKKYSLDYASIKVINPKIIYCSITGFGQTGPYAHFPGYDFLIQGMGGLMSITGERDDLPGGGPQKAGVAVTDILTGMYATVAILAALHERQRSGIGQYIDVSLLECHNAMLTTHNSNFFASGISPQRVGNAHQNIVPYQVFAASDGHLIVAVGNDSQYRAYCSAIGHEALAADTRFSTNSARVKNRDILIPILADIMAQGKRDVWIEKIEAVGVPVGPINTLEQVFADPHIIERQVKVDMPHPTAQHISVTANPIKFSDTPIQYHRHPPTLGEHNREVLREVLGYSEEQIQAHLNRVQTP